MIESLKNKSNSIALIGSSNDPRKYGNKILLDLTKKGYTVYPVNKKEKEIEGLKAYKNIEALEEIPSIINFVIPPEEGLVVTRDLVEKGYDNFWYQPGAESDEISEFLKINKKNYIDDKCIMVVTRLSSNY
ncbi:CoA-binding protein [Acidimicrobiaceae bacterium]|nr:CoA-binding protein [Acidimicrobiaceae bacterium]